MHRLLTICLVALAATNSTPYTQASAPWHDPSPHKVQFVTVEEGVRLEVLDWGGSGRNVVLLAGSGNTAHVFDDFAPKLSQYGHVYGITRRGFGASTHPDSGYGQQRLADDVLQVLDVLKIVAPVLAGHSMSGEELTTLGDEHSDRLAGLVYLDATSDPTDYPGNSAAYMALFDKLPAAMRANGSKPDASDLSVVCQQVVPVETGTTDGWSVVQTSMRAVPVVLMEPDGELGGAHLGVVVGAAIGPFP